MGSIVTLSTKRDEVFFAVDPHLAPALNVVNLQFQAAAKLKEMKLAVSVIS
jgi:hypothetical protein